MKKIVFATLAIAVLASCNKENTLSVPETAVIEFDQAFINNTTKAATDFDKNNLANFGVYGSVENNSGIGMIFNNVEVTKNNGKYTYSPAQYWVEGATYNFTAFAPSMSFRPKVPTA